MSVEIAQRRLLETLAALHRDASADIGAAPDPLTAMAAGIDVARELAQSYEQHTSAAVYAALIDLLAAVAADLDPNGVTHG